MTPSPALQQIITAKRLSTPTSLALELRNRRIRPTGSRLQMYKKLLSEYRTDERLGWTLSPDRNVKILPVRETPNMFKMPIGRRLISITHFSDARVVVKFGNPDESPARMFLLDVLPGADVGGVMVSMDDVLTRNLRVALSPPLFRLGPGNVLVLGVRPVVVDSCLALGKVPNGLGSFMMLGLKLEGMGEMGFLSFLPVNITPGDPTCTGDLTLDALDLAGYGD